MSKPEPARDPEDHDGPEDREERDGEEEAAPQVVTCSGSMSLAAPGGTAGG